MWSYVHALMVTGLCLVLVLFPGGAIVHGVEVPEAESTDDAGWKLSNFIKTCVISPRIPQTTCLTSPPLFHFDCIMLISRL